MSLTLVYKNTDLMHIPIASLSDTMYDKHLLLDIIKRNIRPSQIQLERIPIVNTDLSSLPPISVPSVIQIENALIEYDGKCPNLYHDCQNIYHWVISLRKHHNLVVQYNNNKYLNLGNKFIDFQLGAIYDCPVYYSKITPKYVVIEDSYGQIKYDLVNKLKHVKTLILTNRPKYWHKHRKNITSLGYKYITKSLNTVWNMIILDSEKLSRSQIEHITKLKTDFGIIFTDNLKDYHNLYSIITRVPILAPLPIPPNHNLHTFLLTNYFRKIEPPTHLNININYIPLKLTPLESRLYQLDPNKLVTAIPPSTSTEPCYICYGDMVNNTIPTCGHNLCFNCFTQSQMKCPMCRKSFDIESIKVETTEKIGTKLNYVRKYNKLDTIIYSRDNINTKLAETYRVITKEVDDIQCKNLILLDELTNIKEWLYRLDHNIKIIVPYIVE